MAVTNVPVEAVLQLVVQIGTDAGGNAILRTRTYNRVKTSAADQNVFDVAQALANLQTYSLNMVKLVSESDLIQA